MKSKILITYDLHAPEKNYEDLTNAIQKNGKAKRILDSVWVVRTHLLPNEFAKQLQNLIDADDKLFVTQMGDWEQCHFDQKTTSWLLYD